MNKTTIFGLANAKIHHFQPVFWLLMSNQKKKRREKQTPQWLASVSLSWSSFNVNLDPSNIFIPWRSLGSTEMEKF